MDAGPLCFTALQSGSSVSFSRFTWKDLTQVPVTASLQISTDGQKSWTPWDGYVVDLDSCTDGKVFVKALNDNTDGFTTISGNSIAYFHKFTFEGLVSCSGNVQYMLTSDGKRDDVPVEGYYRLFYNCKNMTTAPTLPAKVMGESCYDCMFQNCTALTQPPKLPSTQINVDCYDGMFAGCTSLKTAPELPATDVAMYCYYGMFEGCTSLEIPPDLPASKLQMTCYMMMFKGCTSLKRTMDLSHTTLIGNGSCNQMFCNCTSIEEAPKLPATNLTDWAYDSMFKGCTNLSSIPEELPATTIKQGCYEGMFSSCTKLTHGLRLPATSVPAYAYDSMFGGCPNFVDPPSLEHVVSVTGSNAMSNMFVNCKGLKTPPKIGAKNLSAGCYHQMFCNCSSLEEAPELVATTLKNNCYERMFKGCTSLTKAPDLIATTLASKCYNLMFDGCEGIDEIHMKQSVETTYNSTTHGVLKTGIDPTFDL